jgi:hypothetical protein
MNPLKSLFLVGVATVSLSSAAHAQTELRLTGSTAFRSATHAAITKILAPGYRATHVGSTLGSAGQATFSGTLLGTTEEVVIKTSWSGSVGGVHTVSQNIDVNFIPVSALPASGTTTGAAPGAEAGKPDVAMTDNFQAATPFPSPVLVDKPVGVVPFKWVASKGAPAGLSNINPQLAQAVFGAGSAALSLFTGLAADEGMKVFATGRDPDSGTRLTTFAEAGVGVNAEVVQYQPSISSGAVTAHVPWPETVVNGITFRTGNGGYSSGGSLVTTMQATTAALSGYYVSYMGLSDATSAINNGTGAKELTYNGVLYSLDNVKNGLYTFWCYEHLMYKSSLTGVKKTVADTLATQIETVDAPIKLSDMRVSREADGGLVTAKF